MQLWFCCVTVQQMHGVSERHLPTHFFIPAFSQSSIQEMLTEHLLCARHRASRWGYSMNKSDTVPAFLTLKVWQGQRAEQDTTGVPGTPFTGSFSFPEAVI